MRKVMQDFELHKKAFHSLSMDTRLDLPAPLDKLNKPGHVESGELTISQQAVLLSYGTLLTVLSDDMASFFDPCVDEVIYLIQGQITQIEAKRSRTKVICLDCQVIVHF